MGRQLGRLGYLAVLAFLVGCGGDPKTQTTPAEGRNAPPQIAVAAVGDSESELRSSIEAAIRSGYQPRYVRVHTMHEDHLFSPYAQLLRTPNAIIARGYGRMFIWNAQSAAVFWNAEPGSQNARLPNVDAPKIDAAAKRLRGEAADETIVLSGARSRKRDDPWAGLKDPWQISPDYVYVNPAPIASPVGAIASNRRKPSFEDVCSINGNTLYGCYYYYYSYYDPWGTGPRHGGGGGGGGGNDPPMPPPGGSGCKNLAKTADEALKAILAKYPGILNPAPTSTQGGNTTEAYAYLYQGFNGTFLISQRTRPVAASKAMNLSIVGNAW